MADETSKGLGQGLGLGIGLLSAPILITAGVFLVLIVSCLGCVLLGGIGAS